ncbi:hypothetical protein [Micromonospora sp. NPDC005197]|uniref:hypothetical protein n=1 Tax=Micromonospora sp. NPDC005197 TaxID=3157020 RepID=UPI0033B0AC79
MSEESFLFFVSAMRDNKLSHEKKVGRHSFSLVLVVCAFELLARGMVSEVSVLGVKIENLFVATLFLPTLAAYFFNNVVVSRFEAQMLSDALGWVIARRYPTLYSTGLYALPVAGDSWMSSGPLDGILDSKWLTRTASAVFSVYAVVIGLGSIAFAIYANVRLFFLPGSNHYLIVASILMTTFFLAVGITRAVLFSDAWGIARQTTTDADSPSS